MSDEDDWRAQDRAVYDERIGAPRTLSDMQKYLNEAELYGSQVYQRKNGLPSQRYYSDPNGRWFHLKGGTRVPPYELQQLMSAGAVFYTDAGKYVKCASCPRAGSYNYDVEVLQGADLSAARTDMLFVLSQPMWNFERFSEPPKLIGMGLLGDQRSVLTTALQRVAKTDPRRQFSRVAATFSAQCLPLGGNDEKPSAQVLNLCKSPLLVQLETRNPRLIVAFGATPLRQLGVTSKFMDVRGRILEPAVTGLPAPLLVTFSEAALAAAPGLFATFLQDLENGYTRLERGEAAAVTLESLTADYTYPQTIDEALAVCRLIRDYTGRPDMSADEWVISVDTETTSLRPERPETKVIAFCFAWDSGKSTTILFDHPNAPPEYLERLPELQVEIAALLASPKPKTFHNAKFDLKWIELKYQMPVNNVVWCSLLGEHLLDEDKKGNYGLKALTAVWIPHFCGYEDKLHDILEASDGGAYAHIDEKLSTLSEEHSDYADALRGYRTEMETYAAKKAAYEADLAAYEAELELWRADQQRYKAELVLWEARPRRPKKPVKPKQPRGLDVLDAAFEDYTKELQVYDAELASWEAWEDAPKPKAAGARPGKPDRLERPPGEPEDPRSRKEREFNTDAGFEKVPLLELQTYGAVDTDVTRQLTKLQRQRLAKEKKASAGTLGAEPLMLSHAIPASRVLGRMEYYGTTIDQDYVGVLDKALTQIIDETKAAVESCIGSYKPNGQAFNIGSGAHIAEVVYHTGWKRPDGQWEPAVECLEHTKKTKKESTTESALKPYIKYDEKIDASTGKKTKVLRPESFLLERLFLYKKAIKARDTFLMNLRVLSKRDRRVHTSFHINGTGTGRLSSSDMNLQNVPKKLAGWSIKKLFIPDTDDFVFVNADYKGAEVRVFTAYARDEKLIAALNNGLDMHSFFASLVFKRPYEDYQARDNPDLIADPDYRLLLDKERSNIKRVVFGILYGAGEGKIAETIGISREEAREIINKLFEMFPDIKGYIEEVNHLVLRDGFVETMFGRRRRFPLTTVSRHKSRAQRQACNFKIQSTSSDIVLGQVIEMDDVINSDKTWPEWGIHQPLHTLGVRLLLTVHDSIVLQWPKKIIRALGPWMKFYGETRVRQKYSWLPVPFAMDVEVGPSYGECKPLEKYLKELPYEEADEGLFEEQQALAELRVDAFEGDE